MTQDDKIMEQSAERTEVIPVSVSDTLYNNYMPYAMSVIVSRAIPEIDGFKPSHRKLLYTMYKMGLMSGPRAKSADIVGQTMQLNPHGDQAIYETMVRLTRGNGTLLHPWIDSKGNFGSVTSRDMQYAAARYTEARLDPSCETIFDGLDKNAVDMIDNYSGTTKEPRLLPAKFPTILVNNNQGIAVGMASNICSFNLSEVCNATIALLKDPEVDLIDYMPAPDFSTAAELIYDQDDMRDIYETGRGSFKLRGTAEINRKDATIEIREIPYTTTIETIIDDISDQIKKNRLQDITNVRDETDLNGLCISIEYKRTADPDILLHKLFENTSLEHYFSCNFNILIDNKPRVMGVREILNEWIKWRMDCIRRETRFSLEKKRERLHILRGYEAILLDIDLAIQVIRNTEKEREVIPRLMKAFTIDKEQAEAVAEIKLRNLNREYIIRRLDDIKDLMVEIEDLEKLENSARRQRKLISDQLKDLSKKYGRERRTRLIDPDDIEVPEVTDLIPDYNIRIFLTEEGYFKKLALTSLRGNFDLKLKENDRIIIEEDATNQSELIFLTDKANAYKMMAWEIEDSRPSLLGEYTPNLLELEAEERVVCVHAATEPFEGEFIAVFANGKGVRFDASHYETKQNRRKLIKAFSDSSEIRLIRFRAEDQDPSFALQTEKGKMLIFDSSQLTRKITRSAQGTAVIRGAKKDPIVKVVPLEQIRGEIEDETYYRVQTLPGSGRYIREKTLEGRQLSLID
ncbi:MAG TPA: DNA topoisomerase (ATP-hydrolyzing) subunit A [Oscillospiraceae bacterium]|nr:DNA topoisomerase (ATP-hydrolyzing) subunit A [Oscillospiraceae bacterium]